MVPIKKNPNAATCEEHQTISLHYRPTHSYINSHDKNTKKDYKQGQGQSLD